jgi:hypothetical protein
VNTPGTHRSGLISIPSCTVPITSGIINFLRRELVVMLDRVSCVDKNKEEIYKQYIFFAIVN